jgi:hypothetical protein
MIGSFKWGEKKEEVVEIDGIKFRCQGIEHWSYWKVDGTFLTGIQPEDKVIEAIKKKLEWK